MKAKIIKIGNSKGIRFPKVVLEESGLREEVEMRFKKGEVRIINTAAKRITPNYEALMSEKVLAKDWLRPEEDEAWAYLQ